MTTRRSTSELRTAMTQAFVAAKDKCQNGVLSNHEVLASFKESNPVLMKEMQPTLADMQLVKFLNDVQASIARSVAKSQGEDLFGDSSSDMLMVSISPNNKQLVNAMTFTELEEHFEKRRKRAERNARSDPVAQRYEALKKHKLSDDETLGQVIERLASEA